MSGANPVHLTAGDIAEACRGRVIAGDASAEIAGFSIDTRTLARGDLFFAIRGDRFDGHQFVAAALEKGAVGAVISIAGAWPDAARGIAILVDDTTVALQRLATWIRRRSGARVIAVTGSAGKTTTKEIAADFLSSRFRVFRNKGNLNNHIGLPLSLLELRHAPDVAVVELGMNHPGEIRTLVNIAEPDVRVWTNVGDAHLGFFGSSDQIADAKAEILEHASASTVLVANADDERVSSRARTFAGRVVTFGIDRPADVKAESVEELGVDGTRARLRTGVGERDVRIPLLGRGNLANVLAATAVALTLGVPLDDIVARTAVLKPALHRGEVLRLANGITVVDDSYNSSPSALRRALETIARSTGFARKGAVLGEMLELGAHAARLHASCGADAARSGLAWLVAVGGEPAVRLAEAAREAGMPSDAVVHARAAVDAAEITIARARRGDLVLVKGSRGIGTDAVVQRLKEAAA